MTQPAHPLAELDQAWEHLSSGAFAQASDLANRVLTHHPDEPEPYHLLAEIALEEGRTEDAARHAEQALSRDEGYFPARFLLAWLALENDEFETARRLAEKALRQAPTPDDQAESRLLLYDIAEALDEPKQARRHLLHAAELPLREPALAARVACHLIECFGEARRARSFLEPLVKEHPKSADLHYYLGRACQELGDFQGQVEEFLLTYDLDSRGPAPMFCLSPREFEECAEETLASLPSEVQERLREVAILAEPRPARALVAEGLDPRLMGLFDGPTQNEVLPVPIRILLFQRNIEAVCTSCEEVRGEIAKTLLHEIGHYLGLDEEDLFARGLD
jgi:predicted Zn-dependent protease with MMP-like domain/Flp pilus assembly protein TadD